MSTVVVRLMSRDREAVNTLIDLLRTRLSLEVRLDHISSIDQSIDAVNAVLQVDVPADVVGPAGSGTVSPPPGGHLTLVHSRD